MPSKPETPGAMPVRAVQYSMVYGPGKWGLMRTEELIGTDGDAFAMKVTPIAEGDFSPPPKTANDR